jgi:hypothetical protein
LRHGGAADGEGGERRERELAKVQRDLFWSWERNGSVFANGGADHPRRSRSAALTET